ncbi:hypothetical protein ACQEU5_07120 [Marinactinospora thermotolerans]|uniref:hypothetical protein n=1 Tax=Marinactinospora thermotolerans TaxID=531310 RepID=UPI003D8C55C2
MDFTRVIATVVTAASAVFTVWSVWDLLAGHGAPHAVGLGAGIGVEAVWLWVLAIEHQQASRAGRVSPVLTRTGWVLAAGAAVVLLVHGLVTSWPMALLAVLPVAAKAGWHWLTKLRSEEARRAEEEARRRAEEEAQRASRLSAELTEEQRAELAELERETAYVTAKTEKELALAAARAHAEQQRALAEIRRQAEQQMALDEGAADVELQRIKLKNKLRLAAPVYSVAELPQAPDDLSELGVPPVQTVGFGFTPTRGASPADLRTPPSASPGASPGGAAPSGPERLLAYMQQAEAATVKGAAREMGVDPRTIRRWRDGLAEAGHDVSVLGGDR